MREAIRRPPLVAAVIGWLLGAAACGGETAAKHAPAEPGQRAEETPDEQSEADEGAAAPASRRNTCDDGTCFRCGDGICPIGFYCDQGAHGGPACSWLPSCPSRATCACIERVLGANCRCEGRGEGAEVSCS